MAKVVKAAASSKSNDRRLVRIVVDHVYLPIDAEGNAPNDWREAETRRVERGATLAAPQELIDCLAGCLELV